MHCEPIGTIIRCQHFPCNMRDGTYTIEANTLTRIENTDGYYVGMVQNTYLKTQKMDEFRAKIYARLFKTQFDAYLGVWTDKEGLLNIDPSKHYDDLFEAYMVAKSLNQYSIWDCEANDELVIDYENGGFIVK